MYFLLASSYLGKKAQQTALQEQGYLLYSFSIMCHKNSYPLAKSNN